MKKKREYGQTGRMPHTTPTHSHTHTHVTEKSRIHHVLSCLVGTRQRQSSIVLSIPNPGISTTMRTGVALSNIKRVVSVFILHEGNKNDEARVALFRRCSQMPTFPRHWAAISGSIETQDVSPLAAAVRELEEETNLGEIICEYYHLLKSGLYVDVSKDKSKGTFDGRVIRVYPFALALPSDDQSLLSKIEMRGTEHDQMKFLTISDFLGLNDEQCVPSLTTAFHHATAGNYMDLPPEIREWQQDRVNGSAYLARQAVDLAAANTQNEEQLDENFSMALSIAILRPSMVPIVNVMNQFNRRVVHENEDVEQVKNELKRSLIYEGNRCIELGCNLLMKICKAKSEFVVGTFSRSSTLKQLIIESLENASSKMRVVCSQSSPGDEGKLMATDIPGASCLSDEEFQQKIMDGNIDVVIVGADCVLLEGHGVVNKIGTAELASVCKQAKVPIISCADRWKLWDDVYCPPLEDIFELIPTELFDHVLVPREDEGRKSQIRLC